MEKLCKIIYIVSIATVNFNLKSPLIKHIAGAVLSANAPYRLSRFPEKWADVTEIIQRKHRHDWYSRTQT